MNFSLFTPEPLGRAGKEMAEFRLNLVFVEKNEGKTGSYQKRE